MTRYICPNCTLEPVVFNQEEIADLVECQYCGEQFKPSENKVKEIEVTGTNQTINKSLGKIEGTITISGSPSICGWIQWHYKTIMGGTMMAAVKRMPQTGSFHSRNGVWYPLYYQNCVWPVHIEQLCKLKDNCPVKKGMTAAEEVELCPMYGSGKKCQH